MAETLKERVAKKRADNPYANQIFASQNRGKVAEYSQQVNEGDQQATVSARGPGMIVLFKPGPYGHMRVEVPVTNLDLVLPAGYLPERPDSNRITSQQIAKPREALPPPPNRTSPIPTCRHVSYDRPPG